MESESILKVEPIGYADGLDVGFGKRKREESKLASVTCRME